MVSYGIRLTLAQNLKAQRNKLGFSQKRLAKISDLSIQTINDIEGGRRWVSDKTITKLSIALNVECYQLLIPDYFNNKIASPTKNLMKLKANMHKSVNNIIDAQFTDFIKTGWLK